MTDPNTPQLAMDIGWQIYIPNIDLLASFNSSVSFWPSSTRAELTAVASLIVTLPIDSTCHIYTDSQAVYNGLNSLTISSSMDSKELKRSNSLIWTLIHSQINKKHLQISSHKVKAHSD